MRRFKKSLLAKRGLWQTPKASCNSFWRASWADDNSPSKCFFRESRSAALECTCCCSERSPHSLPPEAM